MAAPGKKPATYEDLFTLPDNVVGEIVNGELHVSARPGEPHIIASSALGEELGPPFKRGKGGPGGWVILDEPELHLGHDILVPDLAGWRRERYTKPTQPYFTVHPDWACEVLSPSTSRIDRIKKLPVYARELIAHIWFVDPIDQTLEVYRLDGETYRVVMTAGGDDKVRAEPFDAIELELAILWQR